MRVLPALVLALLLPGAASAATLVHCGRLLDGNGGDPRSEVTVVVEDGRFTAVEDGYRTPGADDTVIDLTGHTVLPGLMDMHVHLDGEISRTSYSEGFTMDQADFALRAAVFAERTLLAGFTTVRDLGDDGVVIPSLRDAIARGWAVGPRIFAAGKALGTTGGHADPTNGLIHEYMGDPGPAEGVVNGPEDAVKGVRQRYKEGSDLIKITATGGVLSLARNGQNPQFTEEEIRAVVATANDYGFRVAAHAHGAEGMKRAVLGGVTSIEHGTYMNEEVMDLMKERGTWYVPTILAGAWVAEKAEEDGFFPEVVRPKAAAIGPVIQDTFGRAYRRGVRIAFGTDSGVSAHGDNAREFELMVEAGMPPAEAIVAATRSAAELLGREDELGTVEPGKRADLVAVEGDPLEDVSVLRHVAFVMKDGTVYKHP